MELSEILTIYHNIDEDSVRALSDCCHTALFAKGEEIVAQGSPSDSLFLVKSGVFRVSSVIDGVEDTICFGHDGDAFLSFHSFYAHEPAQLACVALTPLEAYRIRFSDLETLMARSPQIMMCINRMLVEELYLLERRYVYFGAKDAYSRYKTFVAARPDIMRHVPVKYVAQYLKVRPETLYRIRARFVREGDTCAGK
ncbi:MAG: Crp/Fnr family transcriptional regulator [Muribaculaceae bacterium]|nr:Crp/Fnr family transcriptional regulator [Muribaculaceae bacterium]